MPSWIDCVAQFLGDKAWTIKIRVYKLVQLNKGLDGLVISDLYLRSEIKWC